MSEIEVKSLEWREHGNGWFADRYRIWKDAGDPDLYIVSGWASGTNPYESLEAAKAAAQSDFASRIRSCLLDKPEAVEAALIADLSALVRMLVRKCEKAGVDPEYMTKARDFLKRKGLEGSPLRARPADTGAAQSGGDLHTIAYNAGLEIRYAVASSGRDPIQHIPEVDAIIERRLNEARRKAFEEAAEIAENIGDLGNGWRSCRASSIAAAIRQRAQEDSDANS